MLYNVESEAQIVVVSSEAGAFEPDAPPLVAQVGAARVLRRLPSHRLGVLATVGSDLEGLLATGELVPETRTATFDGDLVEQLLLLAVRLETTVESCVVFTDDPFVAAEATRAGFIVVALGGLLQPHLFECAYVVPSFVSIQLLGSFPLAVFEIDAIPGAGARNRHQPLAGSLRSARRHGAQQRERRQ